MQTVVMIGGSRRRYRQGRGCHGGLGRRRYRQGGGPKMAAFKSFLRKGAEFGKRHVLPHLKEIGTNMLLDVLEGKNLKQSLKGNLNATKNNLIRQQRRHRRAALY